MCKSTHRDRKSIKFDLFPRPAPEWTRKSRRTGRALKILWVSIKIMKIFPLSDPFVWFAATKALRAATTKNHFNLTSKILLPRRGMKKKGFSVFRAFYIIFMKQKECAMILINVSSTAAEWIKNCTLLQAPLMHEASGELNSPFVIHFHDDNIKRVCDWINSAEIRWKRVFMAIGEIKSQLAGFGRRSDRQSKQLWRLDCDLIRLHAVMSSNFAPRSLQPTAGIIFMHFWVEKWRSFMMIPCWCNECVQMMMNTLLHSHEVFRSLLAFLSALISIIKQALPFHRGKAVGNSNEFTCASHSGGCVRAQEVQLASGK